jgi:preprotein translocase subunit Sec63
LFAEPPFYFSSACIEDKRTMSFVQVATQKQAKVLLSEAKYHEVVATLLKEKSDQKTATNICDCTSTLDTAMKRLESSPYVALKLGATATEPEIKKAYRLMALKYHPDKNNTTTSLFQVTMATPVGCGLHRSKLIVMFMI